MYIACLCPNLVSVHFCAIPILCFIYLFIRYSLQPKFSHLLGDIGDGIRGIANSRSFTDPLNIIVAWWVVGERHVITTWNRGGYVPITSISSSSSVFLFKKSMSLTEICKTIYTFHYTKRLQNL